MHWAGDAAQAGERVEPLLDRDEILTAVRPEMPVAERRRLDTVLSRFKLDSTSTRWRSRPIPRPAPLPARMPPTRPRSGDAAAWTSTTSSRGHCDLLAHDAGALATWREVCRHLLVDEAQDLDRAQLRLALLLAAPANRIFLVGDDDQSIYGWRLADVRRQLGLADEALPGLMRVDLETNYRCPAPVLERAVRLVEHNVERFAKVIRAGRRPRAAHPRAIGGGRRRSSRPGVLTSWPTDDDATRASCRAPTGRLLRSSRRRSG
jgi:hypothetical protein